MAPPVLALSRPVGDTGRLLDLLILALLTAAVGVAVADEERQARRWLALQGLASAAGAALLAGASGQRGLFAAAGIVAILKVAEVAIGLARRPTAPLPWHWPGPCRSGFGLAAFAVALEILAFLLVPSVVVRGTAIAGPVLTAAFALVLAGLAALPVRPGAALLTMGNGATFLALNAATGPSPELSLCLVFDLLVLGLPAAGPARYDGGMH